ncbi:hypothetical protein ABW19_dt0209338 [Dactylella cylindrospora]|nr:hypothetical protein ABW19_dt0209338 [Dactylella cylindrospora]
MGILCLPNELLRPILEDIAADPHIYGALELRLVNKVFDQVMLEAVIAKTPRLELVSDELVSTVITRRIVAGNRWRHLEVFNHVYNVTDALRDDSYPGSILSTSSIHNALARAILCAIRRGTPERDLRLKDLFRPRPRPRKSETESNYNFHQGRSPDISSEDIDTSDSPIESVTLAKMRNPFWTPSIPSHYSNEYFSTEIVTADNPLELATTKDAIFAKAIVSIASGHLVLLPKLIKDGLDIQIIHPHFGNLISFCGYTGSENDMYYLLMRSRFWQLGYDTEHRKALNDILVIATSKGYSQVVSAIVDSMGYHDRMKPEPCTHWGYHNCPLIDAAVKAATIGNKYILSFLVRKCTYIRTSALRAAASNGQYEIVRSLIEDKTRNIDTGIERDILGRAARSGSFSLVKYLLEGGFTGATYWDRLRPIRGAIHQAIVYDYVEILGLLLAYYPVAVAWDSKSAENEDWKAMLRHLAYRGSPRALSVVLHSGLQTLTDWGPIGALLLKEAAQHDHVDFIRCLQTWDLDEQVMQDVLREAYEERQYKIARVLEEVGITNQSLGSPRRTKKVRRAWSRNTIFLVRALRTKEQVVGPYRNTYDPEYFFSVRSDRG